LILLEKELDVDFLFLQYQQDQSEVLKCLQERPLVIKNYQKSNLSLKWTE
jgi:hypothetical protein